jgi:hypothetical protein
MFSVLRFAMLSMIEEAAKKGSKSRVSRSLQRGSAAPGMGRALEPVGPMPLLVA